MEGDDHAFTFPTTAAIFTNFTPHVSDFHNFFMLGHGLTAGLFVQSLASTSTIEIYLDSVEVVDSVPLEPVAAPTRRGRRAIDTHFIHLEHTGS